MQSGVLYVGTTQFPVTSDKNCHVIDGHARFFRTDCREGIVHPQEMYRSIPAHADASILEWMLMARVDSSD